MAVNPRLYPCSSTQANNDCVPTALGALTGEPAETWLERLRAIDPKCCSASRGCSPITYRKALKAQGYQIEVSHFSRHWPDGGYKQGVPFHMALASLKGRKALVVVRTSTSSHAVAAQGFMVCDNSLKTPEWWADWQSTRMLLAGRFVKRYVALSATIINGKEEVK